MNIGLINVLNYCAGTIGDEGIPTGIGNLVHLAVVLIQVVVPILLVLWGMLDFAKGVMGQDEDKIKAGQKKFIQRLIAAAIVFLIVTVVQLVINVVAGVADDKEMDDSLKSTTAWDCAKQLINGEEASN